MTTEEKAKAYDEALERAKEFYILCKKCGAKDTVNFLEDSFPELRESEDEKIRKALVDALNKNLGNGIEKYGTTLSAALAWLEKQGEQKPDDNRLIPQKGEYYVCIKDYYSADGKTTNTKGKIYKSPCDGYINDDKGFGLSWINSCTENHFRPIKEEDWIICEQNNVIGNPLQYKEFMNNKLIQKNIKSLEDNGIVPNFRLWDISDAKDGDVLATLDHILIFEGIISKNGGVSYCHYDFGCSTPQFDFNKDDNWYFGKEAIIHPATKEQRDALEKAMADAGYIFDFEKKELKKIEQKPAWSEEDESYLNTTIAYLKDAKEFKKTAENCINWLKSLRPQSTWKPSNEQMLAVDTAINVIGKGTLNGKCLIELYEQLKKLRRE